MSRFHFYAPFIKKLSLDSYSHALELDSWEPLATYSRTTEILPNLVEIVCWKINLASLSVFLSSSTQVGNLRVELPYSEVGELLALIARRSPQIRELEFYPEMGSSIKTGSVENFLLSPFASLSKFYHLRRLGSSTAILQPHALQLVAQLPNLTDLRLCADSFGSNCSLLLDHQLPANAFPSLVTLDIDLETSQDVKKCWELIPLQALNEVQIFIQAASGGDQSQFIPALCRGSPQIRELQISFFKQFNDDDGVDIHHIQATMFEHLRCLPLDRVFSIAYAKLDLNDAWVKVAASWPYLREFRCLHQTMRLEDLKMLSASLPNLCKLECDFDLEHAADTVGREWEPTGYLPFYPHFRELIIKHFDLKELAYTDDPCDLNDLARVFAYFWPNINICFSEDNDVSDPGVARDIWMYREGLFRMFKKLIKAHAHLFHNV
ncbi:hypothetical protein FRC08_002271 [Ceratobasidium sp. 394]|nr:hypothetical protein FRC08_002271 [Ceratobasidium sp. 394]